MPQGYKHISIAMNSEESAQLDYFIFVQVKFRLDPISTSCNISVIFIPNDKDVF